MQNIDMKKFLKKIIVLPMLLMELGILRENEVLSDLLSFLVITFVALVTISIVFLNG